MGDRPWHSAHMFIPAADNDDHSTDNRIAQLRKAIREQHILLEALDDGGQDNVDDLKSRIRSVAQQLAASDTALPRTRYEQNKIRLQDLLDEGQALEREIEYLVETGMQDTHDALIEENGRLQRAQMESAQHSSGSSTRPPLTPDDDQHSRAADRIMVDINALRADARDIVRLGLCVPRSEEQHTSERERQMFEKGLFVSAPLARFIESLDQPAAAATPPPPRAPRVQHDRSPHPRHQTTPPPVPSSTRPLKSQRSAADVKAEAQRRIEERRRLFASKLSRSADSSPAATQVREPVASRPEQSTVSSDEKAAQERLRKAEAEARERLQKMRELRTKARLEAQKRQQAEQEEAQRAKERQRQQEAEQEQHARELAIKREQEEKAAEEQQQRRARQAAEQAAREKRLRQEEIKRKAREMEAAQKEAERRRLEWLAEKHKQEQRPATPDKTHPPDNEQQNQKHEDTEAPDEPDVSDNEEQKEQEQEQQQQQQHPPLPLPQESNGHDDGSTEPHAVPAVTVNGIDLNEEVDFSKIYRAKTLYEYRGTREDDLCFQEDEVIKAHPHKDANSDWWYGTSLKSMQTGFFPRTYVEVIERAFRVRTLYDFQKTRDDDLAFSENEIIVVQPFQDADSEWWFGTNEETHETGYFPKTYVEILPLVPSMEQPSSSNPAPTAALPVSDDDDEPARNLSSAPNTPVLKKETLNANRSETARRRRATSNVGIPTSAPIGRARTSSMPTYCGSHSLVTWASTMDESELAEIPPEERKRQEAIFELISTEKSYLRDLQLIINVFYADSTKYLARDEQDVVFSNIDDLLLANTALLSDLEDRQNEEANVVSKIGDIFLKHADNLNCYSAYCRNQSFASRFLEDKRKQDQWFNVFLKTAQTRSECRGLDLSHFLLEPMQRITRYPLLLQNILKATPKRHPDYGLLRSALIKTSAILEHVNEETRRYENSQKMDELSRILDMGGHGKLKVQGREFVMEGVLYKAKSGRKLHGYLFNDMLVLTEPLRELSPEGYLHRLYKEPLSLDTVHIRQLPHQMSIKAPFSGNATVSDDNGFQLVHGSQVVAVKASSSSQKRQWIAQIQHFSALRSTMRRQSWAYSS